jgi:hypothetical protein
MRGHWSLMIAAPWFLSAVASIGFAAGPARSVAIQHDASRVRVALEASIDGDVIAKREMVISSEEGWELHFAGGGYSWHARINVLSPALVEARRLERLGAPSNLRSQ